jgi:ArsR family transcriptional regulator, lead/cadmium/zinc/bismuth-responsive transcriptional repressor
MKKQLSSYSGRCATDYIHEDKVLISKQHLVDELAASKLARIFRALADPTRVRLISALTHSEMCVCDLAAVLEMSQSAISHQLRSLRDMGLVRSRKIGREVFYALDDDHILELFELGKDHIQHQ